MAIKRKLVVVMNPGPLPELGGIGGPITTPTNVTMQAIQKMIMNGKTVYACDPTCPRDASKRVLLDIGNFNNDVFCKDGAENRDIEEMEKSTPDTGEGTISTDNFDSEQVIPTVQAEPDTPQTDATNETSEKNDVDPEGVIQDNSGTDGLSNEESDNVELPTDKQEIDTALDDMQAEPDTPQTDVKTEAQALDKKKKSKSNKR